jgi:hypothetical protein
MNNDTIPCCAADALWRIRQVKINGIMTGINRLDECIAAVREENLTREDAIRAALVTKVGASNYIPPGLADAYGIALMEEYRKALLKHENKQPDKEP